MNLSFLWASLTAAQWLEHSLTMSSKRAVDTQDFHISSSPHPQRLRISGHFITYRPAVLVKAKLIALCELHTHRDTNTTQGEEHTLLIT